jgi:hypothetical protein
MMIEVDLPNGETLEFPAGTPADVIARAVRDYLGAPRPPAPAEEIPQHRPLESAAPAPAPTPAVVPLAARFRLGPYTNDDAGELSDLARRLPEQAAAGGVCREVLEKSARIRRSSLGDVTGFGGGGDSRIAWPDQYRTGRH